MAVLRLVLALLPLVVVVGLLVWVLRLASRTQATRMQRFDEFERRLDGIEERIRRLESRE